MLKENSCAREGATMFTSDPTLFWNIFLFYSSSNWGLFILALQCHIGSQLGKNKSANTNCLLFVSIQNSFLWHARVTFNLWGKMRFSALIWICCISVSPNSGNIVEWVPKSSHIFSQKHLGGLLPCYNQYISMGKKKHFEALLVICTLTLPPGWANAPNCTSPRSAVKTKRGTWSH